MVDRYRFLSPAVLTQAALYDLAGTNVHRYKHFLRLADGYHAQWKKHIRPMMLRSVKLEPAQIDTLPRWRFQEEATSDVLARVRINLAGLVVSSAIVAVFAALALRRYPVAG